MAPSWSCVCVCVFTCCLPPASLLTCSPVCLQLNNKFYLIKHCSLVVSLSPSLLAFASMAAAFKQLRQKNMTEAGEEKEVANNGSSSVDSLEPQGTLKQTDKRTYKLTLTH